MLCFLLRFFLCCRRAKPHPQHIPSKSSDFVSFVFFLSGILIDFGLAEPAEKWQGRSEALLRHREKRSERKARGKQQTQIQITSQNRTKAPLSATRPSKAAGNQGKTPSSADGGRKGPRHAAGNGNGNAVASGSANAASRGNATSTTTSGREKEDRFKLLGKVERGGTTGFRAPEILWHCRDQVCQMDDWQQTQACTSSFCVVYRYSSSSARSVCHATRTVEWGKPALFRRGVGARVLARERDAQCRPHSCNFLRENECISRVMFS